MRQDGPMHAGGSAVAVKRAREPRSAIKQNIAAKVRELEKPQAAATHTQAASRHAKETELPHRAESTGVNVPLGDEKKIYGAKYRVRIRFRERVCGGTPKDPEIQKAWLETRGFTTAETEEYVRNLREEKGDEYVNEEVKKAWSGFRGDSEGLYLEARQLEAMMREGATELGIPRATRGFRQRLQHGCFVKPHRLRMLKENEIVKEPDGDRMTVVHVMTPKGKVAAFSRFDYVEEAELAFEVLIVQSEMFTAEKLADILTLAQEQGLGAGRSQGEGKFDVLEITQLWVRKERKGKNN